MANAKGAKADNRRADIEQILTAHGVKFDYKGIVPISEIERHIESQSRLRDADRSLVKEYEEKMKRGAIFPPVILWEDGYQGYGIVDGNTRIEAKKKRGETQVDAYIIDVVDANEAVYVSAIFNASHGQRLSKEEIRHAVVAAGLMDNPPTNEQLAQDYGVKPSTVTKIQNVHRITGELVDLGISDAPEMTEAARYSISSLSDTAVKRDLAQLILDSDIPQADIGALTKEIKSKGSEAERLKVISDARTDLAAKIEAKQTGRQSKGQPVAQVSMVFGRILSIIEDYPDVEQWVPVDPDRRADFEAKAEKIRDFLHEVAKANHLASLEV